jgi:drug/metabolite transporter (DMT)-like permease
MDPVVVGLVLLSGVLHVTWNVRVKTGRDPLEATSVAVWTATAVLVAPTVVGWFALDRPSVTAEMAILILASGVVGTIYFTLLSEAYRRGDLSLVYPTARGTSPVIVAAIGVLLLGERLGPAGAVGVLALLVAILVLTRPLRALLAGVGRVRAAPGAGRPAVPAGILALATGVAIAGYTTIDRVGVRLEDGWLYAMLIWPAMSLGLVFVALARRRLRHPMAPGGEATPLRSRLARAAPRRAAVGGLFMLAGYLLVLYALSQAPQAAVSPLRESAVVVGAAWGAIVLGEASDRRDAGRRILASALVVAGVALLVLGG